MNPDRLRRNIRDKPGDRSSARFVLSNLALNAVSATVSGGRRDRCAMVGL
jgi:hypothetical protein